MFYPQFNPNIFDILTYPHIITNINITALFKWLSKNQHTVINTKLKQQRRQRQTKTWLENKQLGNDGDYSVIATSSSHPLLLTEHAANGLVEAALK